MMFLTIAQNGQLVEISRKLSDCIAALDGMRDATVYQRDTWGRLIPVGFRRNGKTLHAGNAA